MIINIPRNGLFLMNSSKMLSADKLWRLHRMKHTNNTMWVNDIIQNSYAYIEKIIKMCAWILFDFRPKSKKIQTPKQTFKYFRTITFKFNTFIANGQLCRVQVCVRNFEIAIWQVQILQIKTDGSVLWACLCARTSWILAYIPWLRVIINIHIHRHRQTMYKLFHVKVLQYSENDIEKA